MNCRRLLIQTFKFLNKRTLNKTICSSSTCQNSNPINSSKQNKSLVVNNNALTHLKAYSTNTTASTTSSVDEEEMKRFRQLASSWWIEEGEFEALHRMNLLRVPLIRDAMINYRHTCNQIEQTFPSEQLSREPLLGLNILDVGCGGGILSEPLARLGATVTGIDACKENVISAELRAELEYEKSNGNALFYERLRYLNCSIEDLASVEENNNYFDAIVMSEVVEHVNNLEDFLVNSTKLLKNKGFSFITTINKTPQSYLMAILAAEYLLGLVPKGTHTWDKFVTPNELKHILEQNDVFVKFQMGMFYNPLTRSWSWMNDNSVNYAIYAQKFKS